MTPGTSGLAALSRFTDARARSHGHGQPGYLRRPWWSKRAGIRPQRRFMISQPRPPGPAFPPPSPPAIPPTATGRPSKHKRERSPSGPRSRCVQ